VAIAGKNDGGSLSWTCPILVRALRALFFLARVAPQFVTERRSAAPFPEPGNTAVGRRGCRLRIDGRLDVAPSERPAAVGAADGVPEAAGRRRGCAARRYLRERGTLRSVRGYGCQKKRSRAINEYRLAQPRAHTATRCRGLTMRSTCNATDTAS
jgi:hypothetical protein